MNDVRHAHLVSPPGGRAGEVRAPRRVDARRRGLHRRRGAQGRPFGPSPANMIPLRHRAPRPHLRQQARRKRLPKDEIGVQNDDHVGVGPRSRRRPELPQPREQARGPVELHVAPPAGQRLALGHVRDAKAGERVARGAQRRALQQRARVVARARRAAADDARERAALARARPARVERERLQQLPPRAAHGVHDRGPSLCGRLGAAFVGASGGGGALWSSRLRRGRRRRRRRRRTQQGSRRPHAREGGERAAAGRRRMVPQQQHVSGRGEKHEHERGDAPAVAAAPRHRFFCFTSTPLPLGSTATLVPRPCRRCSLPFPCFGCTPRPRPSSARFPPRSCRGRPNYRR